MKELICIVCPRGCHLRVDTKNGFAVTGNECPRGLKYGRDELENPLRVITSTVRVRGDSHRRCPVKTGAAIPKKYIFDAMRLLNSVELTEAPCEGQVVVGDICRTGIPFITTRGYK